MGPFLGASAIRGSADTYEELGVVKDVPTPMIFMARLGVSALSFLPALWLRNVHKRAANAVAPSRSAEGTEVTGAGVASASADNGLPVAEAATAALAPSAPATPPDSADSPKPDTQNESTHA